jgi:hypothetical protein
MTWSRGSFRLPVALKLVRLWEEKVTGRGSDSPTRLVQVAGPD